MNVNSTVCKVVKFISPHLSFYTRYKCLLSVKSVDDSSIWPNIEILWSKLHCSLCMDRRTVDLNLILVAATTDGNVCWRRKSARKGLINAASGAQFAPLPLVQPVVWIARAVVSWLSRSVANVKRKCSRKLTPTPHHGEPKQRRRRRRRQWKRQNTIGFMSKTRALQVHRAFSTFLWRPLHDYYLRPPDSTFDEGRGHTTTKFLSLLGRG